MENKATKDQVLAALKAYAESVVGAAVALYLAGVEPVDLAWSLVAALVPVVLRSLDPNDKSFGRMPSIQDVADAVKDVEVKKPPRKAPAKKPAATSKSPAKKAPPKTEK
jgi:hypothetical protein